MDKVLIGIEQLYQGAIDAIESGRFRDGDAFIWIESGDPLEVWIRPGAVVMDDHIRWPDGTLYRPGFLLANDAEWQFSGLTVED